MNNYDLKLILYHSIPAVMIAWEAVQIKVELSKMCIITAW
jgi:hypothetical protein